MIEAYNRAQAIRQKIKHGGGLEWNDQEEVRLLMCQLMVLAEAISLHEHLSFDMGSRGWEFSFVSRVSVETKAELFVILSEV